MGNPITSHTADVVTRKIAVVIPVRLGSKRLARKHLRDVLGRPQLLWLISRLQEGVKAAGIPDCKFIVATTPEAANEELVPLALQGNFECAKSHALTAMAIVDGDDICCSPRAVTAVLKALENGANLVGTKGLPLGMNSWGFTTETLERSLAKYQQQGKLETGWGRIFAESGPATDVVLPCSVDPENSKWRFTLDYDEDLRFMSAIIEGLGERAFQTATDDQIIDFVDRNKLNVLLDGVNERYWQNYWAERKAEQSP